ncbi:furin-like protease 1 isoform X1 [Neodiprion virginianus]|uniref:furin-like protease 1 isoform X1 n=1 Tax=Neodiprion virginianus TaxID=2961670 RepID=UPI001EE6EF6F|nr:furin-like protease 1 isoform X1 [Neodiprion virginianus]
MSAEAQVQRRTASVCAKWTWSVLVLVVVIVVCGAPRTVDAYTNQWAAHIEGGPEVAKQVAADHGFRYLDKILGDWYHMEHRSVSKRSTEPHKKVHIRLLRDNRVLRAEQQRSKSRTKRDYVERHSSPTMQMTFNDEKWPAMWYLNRGNGLDMNVQEAWAEDITGTGIVVTILDDGLEKDHPDLLRNYDPEASYDVNGQDDDPMPRYDAMDSNRHGTRCAGEVAAVANNSNCAVGVAYDASVGGVRMLDGDVTDAVEARSLAFNSQHIHIYSASWGPDDDGKTVDGPGELATRAFIEGITKGREGRGSIFVWASGNGGRDHDNCNCDGYTNSIWTLSISSATENGLVPWYSEACSSTLATTYSSGSNGEKQVVTTDIHHHCTGSHTGTSASAPLAAGICALALEANLRLTWRDMQHIVVRTAKPANLKAPDWVTNGVGRNVSHSFGYGLMDAGAMVKLARRWRTVPEQHKCEVPAPNIGRTIPPKSQITLMLHVKECSGVNFLEHVQAKVSLTAGRRGDLQIQLTSPAGTKSTLLAKRLHDASKAGFNQWPFMSVHTWGERPHGSWKLEIHNEGRYLAELGEWKLVLYGTNTSVEGDELAIGGSKGNVDVDQIQSNVVDTEGDPLGGSQRVDQATHTEVEQTTNEDQTSGACKTTAGNQCLECRKGWFLLDDGCVSQCPSKTYAISNENKMSSVCAPCHYTCAGCSGPADYECTSCLEDATPYRSGGSTHCVLTSLTSNLHSTKWFYRMFILFVLNLVTLTGLGVYFCVIWYVRKQDSKEYAYSKVAYETGGAVPKDDAHKSVLPQDSYLSDSD